MEQKVYQLPQKVFQRVFQLIPREKMISILTEELAIYKEDLAKIEQTLNYLLTTEPYIHTPVPVPPLSVDVFNSTPTSEKKPIVTNNKEPGLPASKEPNNEGFIGMNPFRMRIAELFADEIPKQMGQLFKSYSSKYDSSMHSNNFGSHIYHLRNYGHIQSFKRKGIEYGGYSYYAPTSWFDEKNNLKEKYHQNLKKARGLV